MSYKSKLSEWREFHRIKRQQEKVQASVDCQRVADVVLEKLIEKPFDDKFGHSHFVYFPIHPRIGRGGRGGCDFDSFKPIIQARCQTAFGEDCTVLNDGDSWNVGFWEKN
jgi:hypothetical protein